MAATRKEKISLYFHHPIDEYIRPRRWKNIVPLLTYTERTKEALTTMGAYSLHFFIPFSLLLYSLHKNSIHKLFFIIAIALLALDLILRYRNLYKNGRAAYRPFLGCYNFYLPATVSIFMLIAISFSAFKAAEILLAIILIVFVFYLVKTGLITEKQKTANTIKILSIKWASLLFLILLLLILLALLTIILLPDYILESIVSSLKDAQNTHVNMQEVNQTSGKIKKLSLFLTGFLTLISPIIRGFYKRIMLHIDTGLTRAKHIKDTYSTHMERVTQELFSVINSLKLINISDKKNDQTIEESKEVITHLLDSYGPPKLLDKWHFLTIILDLENTDENILLKRYAVARFLQDNRSFIGHKNSYLRYEQARYDSLGIIYVQCGLSSTPPKTISKLYWEKTMEYSNNPRAISIPLIFDSRHKVLVDKKCQLFQHKHDLFEGPRLALLNHPLITPKTTIKKIGSVLQGTNLSATNPTYYKVPYEEVAISKEKPKGYTWKKLDETNFPAELFTSLLSLEEESKKSRRDKVKSKILNFLWP